VASAASALTGSSGAVVAYVRRVKTGAGAAAVQVVWSSRQGSRCIEHLGSESDTRVIQTPPPERRRTRQHGATSTRGLTAQVLRLQDQIGHQALIFQVRLVLDGVP
jgi:hypothetical protein